jgi:prolyl-tRNA synthetase
MRRDTLEKQTLPFEGIEEYIKQLLGEMQQNIYDKAKKRLDENVHVCNDYEEFKSKVKEGGFYLCPWDGTEETEAQIKADTQATIRCVPYGYDQSDLGVDMVSGKPAVARVVVARSY